MVSIKREGLPAVRDILKPGLVQNNYKMLQIDPLAPPLDAAAQVCTRSPLLPHVGSKLGTRAPLLTLLLRLMFYLILGICWWAKAAGTLKQYEALNKNHFEQCNGNDSSLIIFEYVPLSWAVMCAANNVKNSDKKEQRQICWHNYTNTQAGEMICSHYCIWKFNVFLLHLKNTKTIPPSPNATILSPTLPALFSPSVSISQYTCIPLLLLTHFCSGFSKYCTTTQCVIGLKTENKILTSCL